MLEFLEFMLYGLFGGIIGICVAILITAILNKYLP